MSKQAFLLLMLLTTISPALAASVEGMALLPSGVYTPLYLEKENTKNFERRPVYVEAFRLDQEPITNRQYLDFVIAHPEWKKTQVKRVFADSHYLQHWSEDSAVEDRNELGNPVVNVSWFAASAYCEAREERLPTTDEWEYALADNGRDNEKIQQQLLDWYATPNGRLPSVGSQPANGFGIYDLAGLVWEWTSDFNSFMVSSDSRDSGQKNFFCGGGSLNASNPRDYAAFMRYSYRGSLQGAFTGKNLGFRCAKDAK
ncbi:MAG: formylglycine-generating enzyme family protein [Methylophilaceae bacterium]